MSSQDWTQVLPDSWCLRPVEDRDHETVREVVFAALREYGMEPEPGATDSELYSLDETYFQNGGAFDVLAEPGGEVVGCVGVLRVDEESCELRKMFLRKESRGQGHGKLLLNRAIDRARDLGFRYMVLETATELREAVGLYEKYGFRPYRPDHICERCDLAYRFEL